MDRETQATICVFRWAVWLSLPAEIEAIGNLVALIKYQAKFILLAKWLLAVAFVVNLVAIPRPNSYGALVGLVCGYLAAASVDFYYIRSKLAS